MEVPKVCKGCAQYVHPLHRSVVGPHCLVKHLLAPDELLRNSPPAHKVGILGLVEGGQVGGPGRAAIGIVVVGSCWSMSTPVYRPAMSPARSTYLTRGRVAGLLCSLVGCAFDVGPVSPLSFFLGAFFL